MLYVRDKGQMCNNIFQYIQLYAWGREHGRTTMSMRFAYKYPYFAIRNYPYHSLFFYLVGKMLAGIRILPVVNFDAMTSLDEGLSHIARHKHCLVEGWGHIRLPELVDKYLPEIRQMFAIDRDIQKKVEGSMDKDAINIGVHLRRGDYKTFKNGLLYFEDDEVCRYVNRLLSLLPGDRRKQVHICTNDPNLDLKYYEQHLDCNVRLSRGSAVEDLCLLSECDYIIGPTSSYSLIASMYGKARLYWMAHKYTFEEMKPYCNADEMTLDLFGDFSKMSRMLDMGFIL